MTKRYLLRVVAYIGFAIIINVAAAKRIPPKPVVPVVDNGVQYSTAGDGRDQYVVATDISSGKELWKAKVFHTHMKLWLEEDVQWVFITDLKLMENSLLVRDEKGRCYSVGLKTHRVRKASCGTSFAEPEHASP